ncbi:hypothetical protein [Rhizobium phaseoli]|uniref:hypothetical protein n=1 Tax=Rhizobium phaseoli TaxID=396 RepID=UPI000AB32732|nr:hypothetical protein [Rhizobium phaseoli]
MRHRVSGLVKPDSYAEAASIARLAVPPSQIARKKTGRHFRMFPQVSADSGTVRYAFWQIPKKYNRIEAIRHRLLSRGQPSSLLSNCLAAKGSAAFFRDR